MNEDVLKHFFSLEGRIGIVTGASSGIGCGIAHLLADAGAKIYNLSRNPTRRGGQDFAFNDTVEDISADVSDLDRLKDIVEDIAGRDGLDFLINNAGITKRMRAEDVDQEWWERIHRVNVDAVFFMSQFCYPYLRKSEHVGRIVTISSMAAHLGFAEVAPYCSTKSAVAGITRSLAVEWANDNIRVNSVAPGWIQTNMTQVVSDPQRREKIIGRMPLHRYGHPRNDIGTMVWFLVAEASSYITGQDFAVDGGALSFGF